MQLLTYLFLSLMHMSSFGCVMERGHNLLPTWVPTRLGGDENE